MEGNYPVFYQQKAVGKVQVIKKGLYYSFHCRCRMESGTVCRLVAKWPNAWENLGIPVPEGDGLELDRKLPAKRMGEETPEFLLIPYERDIHEALFGPEIKEEVREKTPPVPAQPTEETVQYEPVENIPEPDQILPDQQKETVQEEEREECSAAEEQNPREEAGETGTFYPIETDRPFAHLDELEQGVLTNRDGQTGVFLSGNTSGSDQISSDSPTGQWSEPIISE